MKTIVLAVIGPHGAGKTSFIESVTECEPENLPETPAPIEFLDDWLDTQFAALDGPEVCLYRCKLAPDLTPFILVDTPGLSARKDNLPSYETIDFIKGRLDSASVELHGVIYLQRSMETTDAEFAVRNIEAFHEAFASDEFRHLLVATTFWDVSPKFGSMDRLDHFHKELRRLGASTGMKPKIARLNNDFESSIRLLKKIQWVSASHAFGSGGSDAEASADEDGIWRDILSGGKCSMI
ncbi:hypothetical protein CTA2_7400 [Colletotrichum tanaceti]|uniref:G domain-containing protein n=1 Tax=Colletotrichum tanaceti TaxID=1306861 RepID=A0A4U6XCF6_9PEZI|nr:hypothetical protein CTA2_7400 [Colletotrichum tanaceti]TKW53275.1 hypothetical protein CTA1_294 [Colletotrichum tanaceti]